MLLGGNDGTGLLCGGDKKLLVKGLYGVDIDHLGADALGCESLCRFECKVYHIAGCGNGNVSTLAKSHALADLELVAGNSGGDLRNGKSAEAEVHRTVGVDRCLDCGVCLVGIGRVDNGHTGDSTHKSDILVALVGRAVLTYGDTRVSCAYLYVKVGITDRVSHLLECSACGEHCKGRCEYYLARGCYTCGNGHHIALCDTAVKKSLGELLFEHTRFRSCGKIRVENEEIVLFAKLGKRRAIAFSGCFLICHFPVLLI